MGNTFGFWPEVLMPWRECSVMEERLRFVARLLDGESMTHVCREFGISRKTGYKIFGRYKEHGIEALTDRSRRPVRYANQLPDQIERMIVSCKRDKPHWGARKIRELLVRLWPGTCAFRQRARCTRCSTAMDWSVAPAGEAAIVPKARRCRRVRRPTICGAPTSRASSGSATAATVTP
jgi:transposase